MSKNGRRSTREVSRKEEWKQLWKQRHKTQGPKVKKEEGKKKKPPPCISTHPTPPHPDFHS